MSKAIVVIPIHKSVLSEYEKVSIVQCCKILKQHEFALVCPDDLNTHAYERIFNNHCVKYKIEKFLPDYFTSIKKYNQLLLDKSFYRRFIHFGFMLIYQLDAYVLRDELKYWCEQEFDYIGAPWFEKYGLYENDSKLLDYAGNGGFSLRKISKIINILETEEVASQEIIRQFIDSAQNEDLFFSKCAQKINPAFKAAPPEIAMRFSFECFPEKLYGMTGNNLPFGTHAWERYDYLFWESFLDLDEIDYKAAHREVRLELNSINRKLTVTQIAIDSKTAEFEKAKLALESANIDLASANIDLALAKTELNSIYGSREWQVALKLQRLIKAVVPVGSLQRKIGIRLWKVVKRILIIIINVSKKISVFV